MENIVIIDFETTQNQESRKEEIIEFAAIELDKELNEISRMHKMINPNIPLTYITKKVTGITESDLTNKPKINEELPKILDYLNNKIIIAHNANFDYTVIKNSCEKLNLKFNGKIVIDSLKIAKNLFPNERNGLAHLKRRFNIYTNHHRAQDDVIATKEVFLKLMEVYDGSRLTKLIDDLHLFSVS